jgi:hypothetical protein
MSSTSVVAAAKNPNSTPQEACRVNICPNLVPAARIFLVTPTRGAAVVNITTRSKAASRKCEGWSFDKKNSGPCGAKNLGIILPVQKLRSNQQTPVQH